MITKLILAIVFIFGFIYLVFPTQLVATITAYPPQSYDIHTTAVVSSGENLSFYTNSNYQTVQAYYKKEFERLNCEKFTLFNMLCFVKPLSLAHVPSTYKEYIQANQQPTYLVEFIYPFRDSIYLSYYMPFDTNGKPTNTNVTPLIVNGQRYLALVTIYYFPSSITARIVVYVGIWFAGYFLFKLWRRILS